jgi:histidinol-phosphate aminotransferase
MNPLDLLRPEIRNLKPYAIEELQASIKLDANESPFDPPKEILENVLAKLRGVHLSRYPDPGAQALKEKIASFLKIRPDRMILGNGSDELIGTLITTFTGRGNGVLYPVPTFSMYGIIARTLGQQIIEVPLNNAFQLDPGPFLETVRERSPQIIFLATPNNPTGITIPEKTLHQILEASESLVVIDEAYIDYSGQPGLIDNLHRYPNLVVLRTLSKIGMASLRVGILTAGKEILQELEKVRLPYNINTLSQTAATILLEYPEAIREQIGILIRERGLLSRAMEQIPEIKIFSSQANFLFFRTPVSDELYGSLINSGILIRNLNQPGALQGCLRVTVGRPEENRKFLEEVQQFFNRD